MKKPNQMALDIIPFSNNVILDPDKVKKHAMKENPRVTDWLMRNAIGGGLYTLGKNTHGVGGILEANRGYWQKPPYFERIMLQFVPHEADWVM